MVINTKRRILSKDSTLDEVITVLENLYIEYSRIEYIEKRLHNVEDTYCILDVADTLIRDGVNEEIVIPVYLRALDAAKHISEIDNVVDAIRNNIHENEWIESFLYSRIFTSAVTNRRAKMKIKIDK